MTAIKFYYGHLGSGKSLRMVMHAVEDYYSGRIILANFDFNKIKYFKVRISQLLEMLPQLNPERSYSLFLDEVQTEADSRDFMKDKNKQFSYFIAQCRKRDINVHYASQWASGADKRLRDLTDYVVRCKAVRNAYDKNQFTNLIGCLYSEYDTQDGHSRKYFVSAEIARLFYTFYNTKQVIIPEELERKMEAES